MATITELQFEKASLQKELDGLSVYDCGYEQSVSTIRQKLSELNADIETVKADLRKKAKTPEQQERETRIFFTLLYVIIIGAFLLNGMPIEYGILMFAFPFIIAIVPFVLANSFEKVFKLDADASFKIFGFFFILFILTPTIVYVVKYKIPTISDAISFTTVGVFIALFHGFITIVRSSDNNLRAKDYSASLTACLVGYIGIGFIVDVFV